MKKFCLWMVWPLIAALAFSGCNGAATEEVESLEEQVLVLRVRFADSSDADLMDARRGGQIERTNVERMLQKVEGALVDAANEQLLAFDYEIYEATIDRAIAPEPKDSTWQGGGLVSFGDLNVSDNETIASKEIDAVLCNLGLSLNGFTSLIVLHEESQERLSENVENLDEKIIKTNRESGVRVANCTNGAIESKALQYIVGYVANDAAPSADAEQPAFSKFEADLARKLASRLGLLEALFDYGEPGRLPETGDRENDRGVDQNGQTNRHDATTTQTRRSPRAPSQQVHNRLQVLRSHSRWIATECAAMKARALQQKGGK